MDKNTVYILQKDLPHVKAGTEFSQENNNPDYYNANFCHYHDRLHKSRIINNPTWFKPKEEVNESKPTEQFQWTNELVMEFVNFHDEQKGIHWLSEDIEKFKQSKSKKEEPQWEILEYKNTTNGDVFTFQSVCNNSIYSDGFKDNTSEFSRQDCFIIESVKRFPDNTVWSVDKKYFIKGWGMCTLKNFKILESGKMVVYFYDFGMGYILSELPTEKAPKEEQVPIKVEIMEFGYGKPQENKGNFYVANFNLPNNAKLPTEKYQSIKSAIEDVLNEDKIKHEKLLSKIESKVRLANMINTQANYLKETLDYINSLK